MVNRAVPMPPVVGRMGVVLFFSVTSSWLTLAVSSAEPPSSSRSELFSSVMVLLLARRPVMASAVRSPVRSTLKPPLGA